MTPTELTNEIHRYIADLTIRRNYLLAKLFIEVDAIEKLHRVSRKIRKLKETVKIIDDEYI